MEKYIRVKGARQHNLKNINVDIPRDKMVVVTGLPVISLKVRGVTKFWALRVIIT